MSLEQATAFFIFAVAAAITPGPSNVLLTAAGATAGFVRGLPCLFGVVLGMGAMMFIVAYGLGQLVLDSPAVLRALKWCGAAFLLWLAWKIATAPPGAAQNEGRAIGFFPAAAFQWVNPKSWLVCMGAVGTFLEAGDSALIQSLAFALVFVAAALPCACVWLGFGALLQRVLKNPAHARSFNRAMGALLAATIFLYLW